MNRRAFLRAATGASVAAAVAPAAVMTSTWPGGGLPNSPGITGDVWRHAIAMDYGTHEFSAYVLMRDGKVVAWEEKL